MPSVTIRPVGVGLGTSNTTIVGAATAWEAISETSADGDTSYITSTGFGMGAFPELGIPTLPTDAVITNVTTYINGKTSTSGYISCYISDGIYFLGGTDFFPASSYGEQFNVDTLNGTTGVEFTRAELIVTNYLYISCADAATILSQTYVVINYTSVSESVTTNALIFAGD